MTNKARSKGTSFESQAVELLKAHGYDAHRLPLSSPDGDIGGIPIVIECKNHKALDLGTWLKQMLASVAHAGKPGGAVWHKRRGQGKIEDCYATMLVSEHLRLLEFERLYLALVEQEEARKA